MMRGGPVYFDYAATTPVDTRVAARMAECLTLDGSFGNPGSSHDFGEAAREVVRASRVQVATAVGAEPGDIVWTSGATEANNLALFGVAHYYRDSGRHLVTLRTEHKAILDPCRELERRGWEVTYLVPDHEGVLDPSQVTAALRPETVLVSVMHVNNETGVVQDIAAIAAACARHGTVRLHVDAAQSVGKSPVEFARWGIDLMSLSGHKAYGPKGVGALVVSRERGVRLRALQFGGGQERNLRSGTVATHQVAGMGMAFELAAAAQPDEAVRLGALRARLWRGVEALGGVLRNGAAERSVAQILNVSFDGVEGESLLAAIRPRVAVSTGSACASATREASYVLRALGRDERQAESSLRFSLGRFTSDADIDIAIETVTRAVRHLRRIGGCGAETSTAEATSNGSKASKGSDASIARQVPSGSEAAIERTTSIGRETPSGNEVVERGQASRRCQVPSGSEAAIERATSIGRETPSGNEASAGSEASMDCHVPSGSQAAIERATCIGSETPSGSEAPIGDEAPHQTASFGGRPSDYSELTWQHFVGASHAGALLGTAVGRGAAGNPALGTWVQFDVRLGVRDGVSCVEAVRFRAFGCPHVIAAADWVAQTATARQARAVMPETVASLRERFAAPVDKLGKFLIVEDAWRMAFLPPSPH